MQVIKQHISVLISEDEYTTLSEEGLREILMFGEIYIHAPNGKVFLNKKLPGGRRVTIESPLPAGITLPTAPSIINEDLSGALPGGKISYSFYERILAFYRKIIEIHKQNFEAKIDLWWNATDGYHLTVPTQKVRHGHVDYEWDHIPPNSVLVLDTHSHGSMDAFFSSEDNEDDKARVSFTGVFGKLNSPYHVSVFRFNCNGLKKKMTIKDLFEGSETSWDIPQEWLDKVQEDKSIRVPSYSGYSGFGKGYTYNYENTGKTKKKIDRKEQERKANKVIASSSFLSTLESLSRLEQSEETVEAPSVKAKDTNKKQPVVSLVSNENREAVDLENEDEILDLVDEASIHLLSEPERELFIKHAIENFWDKSPLEYSYEVFQERLKGNDPEALKMLQRLFDLLDMDNQYRVMGAY